MLPANHLTLLFTDIEGSTRLWAEDPERMQQALACHDRLVRDAITRNNGFLVKTTGDGVYAAFDRAQDAIGAAIAMQLALDDAAATAGVPLRIRCGIHEGPVERRDNDYFGNTVNQAARIMGVAHGGQVLVSQSVADVAGSALPENADLRDLGSVRLKDLAKPVRVFQVGHPGLRRDFPALRSLEATPNNLPQQLSSFIGRESDLAETRRLLRTTRLLTLTGIGGLGKTRLSLQVGADVLDDYQDGVWFVELAPVSDPSLVAQAVAVVLGVKEEGGRGTLESLERFARDRSFLLILDNCEHVARSAAEVARVLLRSGTGAKVLASSREPLHVAGETIYALASLTTPQADADVAALGRSEAIRLFVERAAAAQAGFAVSDANARSIAHICRRLDGMPLAIELAAARVRTMPVEAIEARLSDRFRLLTGGDVTALPRQQTLRGCIEWSHDLLSPVERILMRRISVFAGDFALDAAEQVGAGGEVEAADVVDLLAHLVEKSLAEFDGSSGRYRQLETVRQFAFESLIASAEEPTVRARHLAHYAALAHVATDGLAGADQKTWIERIRIERENLLSAHVWCGRDDGNEQADMQLVLPILVVCSLDGNLELGARVATEALERPGARHANLLRCRALLQACQLAYFMARFPQARIWGEEGLAIARALGENRRIVTSLRLLGIIGIGQGDHAFARSHLEQSVAIARDVGDGYQLSAAAGSLADLLRMDGSLDAAESLYEECLGLCRGRGDRGGEAAMSINLGFVSIGRGDVAGAREHLAAALGAARDIQLANVALASLDATAGLAAISGEYSRCLRYRSAAEVYRQRTGIRLEPADEAFLRPWLERARASLETATVAQAEATGRAQGYDDILTEAAAWLAGDVPLT